MAQISLSWKFQLGEFGLWEARCLQGATNGSDFSKLESVFQLGEFGLWEVPASS